MLSLSFKEETQGGTAITFRIPAQWRIQADQGSGFVDVGTFSAQTNVVGDTANRYYMDLPSLFNVQSLRLVVNESDVPDVDGNDQGIGVPLMEAFDVPEPAGALTVVALAGFGLLTRRRSG
jgi:hypothetical protein